MTYRVAVQTFKRDLVMRTLTAHGGNKTRAARALGLSRTYLTKVMHQLGLPVPPPRYAWPRRVA